MGFFIPASSVANVYVLDSVRTNNMPNMNNLLNAEREKRSVFVFYGLPFKITIII